MSQENVEIVRRVLEGFREVEHLLRRGDFPIAAPIAEDIEWDASALRLPDMGDGHLRGREEVRRFWAAWLSAWDDTTSFDFELRDAGDSVVALIDQSMRGSEKIRVPMPSGQVFTLRDREIVRWKFYPNPNEALEAVGLSE